MRSLVFWVCAPFVLPQALALRRRAPRFAAAAGPTTGEVGDGQARHLLAFGDSIIAGVGAETLATALVGQTARQLSLALQCRITWAAHGCSGANCRDLQHAPAPQADLASADFVLLSVGVNDVTSLSGVRRWRRNLGALLTSVRANAPLAAIALAGLPPLGSFPLLPQPLRALLGLRGRQFDAVARSEVTHHAGVIHVPLPMASTPDTFCADGFHPSEASYAVLGQLMARALLEDRART